MELRRGFTLIELMMVIAILGILVGLAVVGINQARIAIQKQAIALEVSQLAQAVEAYKQKYGEYPPDGSSSRAFEAHFRSIFPNIHPEEFLALRNPSANPTQWASNSISPYGYMDPAEALVFCLGGYSNDPQRPFTGPGGPLVALPGGGYQYNVERNAGQFEFPQDRLTINQSSGVAISNDESTFGLHHAFTRDQLVNDLLPVYVPKHRTMPVVYFSSTSYTSQGSDGTFYNRYSGTSVAGVARPYKSDQINASTTLTPATADRYYRYVNDKSFQIISAGLDDDFGGTAAFWPSRVPVFFQFPTGKPLDIMSAPNAQLNGTNYQLPEGVDYRWPEGVDSGSLPTAQLDNVTNFSEGPLESSLP